PLVHDDVPVGRALPAPDRSRARAHRAHVYAAAARPLAALGVDVRAAVSEASACGARSGSARAAVRTALAALVTRHARSHAPCTAGRACNGIVAPGDC